MVKKKNGLMMFMFIIFLFICGEVCCGNMFVLTMGSVGEDSGYSAKQTKDGGYIITGSSAYSGSQDVLLSKFNRDGTHNWTKLLDGDTDNDKGKSVIEISDGGFIIVGETRSFGAGQFDGLLSKFSVNGTHLWTKTIGMSGNDYYCDIDETRDGGFVAVGYSYSHGAGSADVLLSKFNRNGSLNWTIVFGGGVSEEGHSVRETSDGGFIVTGYTYSFAVGDTDLLLSKFHGNGTHEWSRTVGSTGRENGHGVMETDDGDFIVVGETTYFSYYKVLISKFESDGTHNFTRVLGMNGEYWNGFSICSTPDGGFVLTGGSSGGCILSKFDSYGLHEWTKKIGESSDDKGKSVYVTDDGSYLLLGITKSYGAGNADILFSLYPPNGGVDCFFEDVSPSLTDWNDVTVQSVTVSVADFPALIIDHSPATVQSYQPIISALCRECFGEYHYEKVCSKHGKCIEKDVCTCSNNYDGERCKETLCHGLWSNSSSVCYGHGDCLQHDVCSCHEGYFPVNNCTKWKCGQLLMSLEGFVCNGQGKCTATGFCSCDDGFYGSECEKFNCHGIDSESSEVCSNHGYCLKRDECSCTGNFKGDDCSYDVNLAVGLGVSLPLAGITVLTILCFAVCQVVFISVLIFCVFCVCLCSFCLFGLRQIFLQRKKLLKFGKLKNVDLLIKEQELEDDVSVAHIKMDSTLFEIPFEELKIEKILGEGGSSSFVYLASWRGRKVAFKCFKTRMICCSQENFNEFEREARIFSSISHPSITAYYGSTLKPPRVGILMEFCAKGEIFLYLKNYELIQTGKTYPFSERLRMLLEIGSGMDYLHSRNIVHRDLKCENVLLDEHEHCKIMDFGVSKISDRLSNQKTKRIGTSVYMAPEVVVGSITSYNEKCDVFSFSILSFIILSHEERPYGAVEEIFIENRVAANNEFRPDLNKLDGRVPKSCIDEISELIECCWNENPNERHSFLVICDKLKDIHERCGGDEKNNNILHEDGNMIEQREEEQQQHVEMIMMKNTQENQDLSEENRNLKESNESYMLKIAELQDENDELKRKLKLLQK